MQPFKLEIKQKSVTLKMQTTVNIFSKAEKRERESVQKWSCGG